MWVYANSEEKAMHKWNRKVERIELNRKKNHFIERFEWRKKW